MKKIIPVLVLVLAVLFSTFAVAYADGSSFTPSIDLKGVTVLDEEVVDEETGKPYVYEIVDTEKDETTERVGGDELILVKYSEVQTSVLSQVEKDALIETYETIVTQNQNVSKLESDIDFDQLAKTEDEEYTSANLVVSDIFSLEIHNKYVDELNRENTVITLTLRIEGKSKVVAVIHKDMITGKWKQATIKSQSEYDVDTNSRTIKVVFDSLCPVAVIKANAEAVTPEPEPEPKPEPEKSDYILGNLFGENEKYSNLFIILFAVWGAEMTLIVIELAVKLKKKSKEVKTRSVVPVTLLALFAGIPILGKVLLYLLIVWIAINFVVIICLLIPKKKQTPKEIEEFVAEAAEEVPAKVEEKVEEVPVEEEVAEEIDEEKAVEDNKPIVDLQYIIDEDYFLDEVKNKILLVTNDGSISDYADIRAEVEEFKKLLSGFETIGKVEGISKEALCDFFALNDETLDVFRRDNYVGDKLPIADAYYATVNGLKRNFALVYENAKGGLLVFLRTAKEQIEKISENHFVASSAFPKASVGNGWFVLKIDDTYTLEELTGIIKEAKKLQK